MSVFKLPFAYYIKAPQEVPKRKSLREDGFCNEVNFHFSSTNGTTQPDDVEGETFFNFFLPFLTSFCKRKAKSSSFTETEINDFICFLRAFSSPATKKISFHLFSISSEKMIEESKGSKTFSLNPLPNLFNHWFG